MRQQSSRVLPSNIRCSMTARFVVLVLLAAGPSLSAAHLDSTGATPKSDSTVAAIGTVTDSGEQPLEHATVMVYSAKTKRGYSIYCPTCWVDCGKHALTDARGGFSIGGLNPDLKFKLLAVKSGYDPAFIYGVDPGDGSTKRVSLKRRVAISDPELLVHGRVVDTSGNPVREALIEPQGNLVGGPDNYTVLIGPPEGTDKLSVANDNGEFELAQAKPVDQLILLVSGRGLAPKVLAISTTPDHQTITLDEGVTVSGRVLGPRGTPIPNAEVGLLAADPLEAINPTHSIQRLGALYREVSVGTREDGTFDLANIPAGGTWLIFPKMESLVTRNLAANSIRAATGKDGSVLGIGTVHVQRGFTLHGTIVLKDAPAIPPDMHVTLISKSKDSQIASLNSEGHFEFKGLAKGVYDLAPAVRGYQLSDRQPRSVSVNQDRSDVVLKMERGSDQ